MNSEPDACRTFKFYFAQATEKFGRFSHEAHLYTTWLMLQGGPALSTLAELRRGLMKLAVASGKTDKYHETLTVAWFMLVLEQWQAGETWEDFIAGCPELLKAGLVDEFYGFDVAHNEQARREFVAPA